MHLHVNDALATLREACASLGLGKSGSKRRCFNRLLAYKKQTDMQLTRELASQPSALASEAGARPVPVAPKLSAEEVKRHELCHYPYAGWCEDCVKMKAVPDRHERDVKRETEKELPILSMDFFHTPKTVVTNGVSAVKALWCLAVADSQTGSVVAIPLKRKGDVRYMCIELMRFVQTLGHPEIVCGQILSP